MAGNHLDDDKVGFRKFCTLSEDIVCTHPSCNQVVSAGDPVYHARLREGDYYCSPLCRGRDTRRKIQLARRQTPQQLEYERKTKLRSKYGLSVEEWEVMYADQNGLCAICRLPLVETKIHVDHNHTTGEVRGLLCRLCNPGIGYFQDDPELLMRAAEYLQSKDAAQPSVVAGRGGVD